MPAALGCQQPVSASSRDMVATYDFTDSDVATAANYTGATFPGGFYDSGTNRTYLFRQAWRGNYRYEVAQYYDHAAATYSSTYNAFIDGMTDDDHGVPAGCIDYQGYIHEFGGVHNLPIIHNSTKNPNDISVWNSQDNIGTSSNNQYYAYPHPHALGSNIYLFCRRWNGGSSTTYSLGMVQTTSLSSGVAAWSANQELVTFGTYSRVYQGCEFSLSDGNGGWDIYISATFADGDDNYRQNVYLFIYNTTTGAIRNLQNTFTVAAASLPVTLAQSNANYCVVNQSTTGHYGLPGAMCLDTSGNIHILYNDSPTQGGSNDNTTLFTLYHIFWNGVAWSAPVQVAVQKNRYDGCGLSAIAGGGLQALVTLRPQTNLGTRGGDIYGMQYNGTSWTSPRLVKPGNSFYNLDSINPIKGGVANLRFTFGEVIQPPGLAGTNAGGSAAPTTSGGTNRYYSYGDAGLLTAWAPQAETTAYVNRMTVAPSALRLRAIDELISGLKTSGLWAGFIGFYLPACHDAQAATLNLKGTSFNLTPVASPLWTPDQGYLTDGVASYLNTNYTMSSQTGSSGTGANTSTYEFGFWNLLEGQSANPDMGALGVSGNTGNCLIQCRDTTDTSHVEVNAATISNGATGAQTTAVGHFCNRRNTATTTQFYYNGANNFSDSNTNSTALPNAQMTLGKVGTTFSSRRFAAAHMGVTLLDGDVGPGVLYNILHRYMVAIGAST